MAETKAKSKTKPRAKTQTKARAKRTSGSKAKPAAKAKRASPKAIASSAKTSASKPSSNGHAPSRKATIPLVAGGAALAGTVGGVLIGASRSGGKILGLSLPQPKRVQFKMDSADLAKAAKQVGRFGESVGELTAELKRARQGLAGDNKHSSPIEVLLRGLTARR